MGSVFTIEWLDGFRLIRYFDLRLHGIKRTNTRNETCDAFPRQNHPQSIVFELTSLSSVISLKFPGWTDSIEGIGLPNRVQILLSKSRPPCA